MHKFHPGACESIVSSMSALVAESQLKRPSSAPPFAVMPLFIRKLKEGNAGHCTHRGHAMQCPYRRLRAIVQPQATHAMQDGWSHFKAPKA